MDVRPDHLPPHDKAAEEQLLGALLREPECLPDVQQLIGTESFYFLGHRVVFDAIVALVAAQKAPDIVLVYDHLRRAGSEALEKAGGLDGLKNLWGSVATSASAVYHAQLVHDAALARNLIHAANEILRNAYDRISSGAELVAQAERRILDVARQSGPCGGDLVPIGRLMGEVLTEVDARIATGEGVSGLLTNFPPLDTLLMGLKPGQLITIAARPAQGKSSLSLELAANIAVFHNRTAFFSLEMSGHELATRFLAMRSGVPMGSILQSRKLAREQIALLAQCAQQGVDGYGDTPLFVDDNSSRTVSEIAAAVRREQRKGLKLVVIDYLGLLRPEGRSENRTVEIEGMTRALKVLARSSQVPIIMLAQLNRQLEGRADKRPQLSDLRSSGSIEQDSDVVLFLHPVGDKNAASDWRDVDLIVAKQRNGPEGDVRLRFHGPTTRFTVRPVGC